MQPATPGKRMPRLFFPALLVCLLCPPAEAANVGFREAAVDGLLAGIWYPSEAAPAPMRLGPFDVRYAKDAPPAAGKFGVVVLSHGHGGKYRNHHPTASLLAANGFIVVAPQHAKDAWVAVGRTHAMRWRIGEIGAALAMLAGMPEFRAVMDADNVNAVGYSLGGATLVAAAGVDFKFSVAARHCRRRYEEDAFFCGVVPWWARLWQMFMSAVFSPDDDSGEALTFRKVALAAPVGQVFEADDLATFRPQALILRFKRDLHLRYPFHAEYLRAHMPARAQYAVVDGHHYAFIAPFPAWMTEMENIPIAADPPGFDRAAFLDAVNQRVLAFLKE